MGPFAEKMSRSLPLFVRGIGIGLIVTLTSFLGYLDGLERWGLNALFDLRGPISPKTPIVIVSINEDSFDELNLAWPWPRSLHGEFLDRLGEGKPAVVGFDILFSEPSLYGPEDDQALGDAVKRAGNVILASATTVVQEAFYQKVDTNPPISAIREGAAGYGYVNFDLDDDAFARRAEVQRIFQGQAAPSFDLQIYNLGTKAGLPAHPIEKSAFLINFRGGPKTFTTVPYYRVLNREIDPDEFTGKIVLVGATTPVLHDSYPTPFATQGGMPGVEIHANALETMFQGIPLQRVPRGLGWAFAMGAGILAVWLTNRFRPIFAFGVVLLAAVGFVALGYSAFTWARLVLVMAPVPIALGLGYVATVVENFILEQRKRAALMQLFSQQVSPEIATAIWEHRDEFMSGGRLRSQKLTATILFTDLRGFTSISEKLETQALMDWLNDYMEVMAKLVMTHGGIVDDYYGDAIKGDFGTPFPRTTEAEISQDAVNAVSCALAMERELKQMNAAWQKQGLPTVGMRVGIYTGEVVAGCLGSAKRMKFTTIGDTTNTAARLESYEKDRPDSFIGGSPCRILIGEPTLHYVQGHFNTEKFGDLSLKGKEHVVAVHRILGPAEDKKVAKEGVIVRKARRVPVAGTVMIWEGQGTTAAALTDMSTGGLSVHDLPKELGVGTILPIQFELPGVPGPLKMAGKVVWTAQHRSGFAFTDISPEDRAILESFMTQQAHAQP